MASLDVNKFMPFIAISIVGVAAVVVFSVSNKKEASYVAQSDEYVDIEAASEIDADSTTDTIRALSGHVAIVKTDLDTVTRENKKLVDENMEIANKADAQMTQVTETFSKEIETQRKLYENSQKALLAQLSSIKAEVSEMRKSVIPTNAVDMTGRGGDSVVEGFGLDGFGLGGGSGIVASNGGVINGAELIDAVWINPLDRSNHPDSTDSPLGGFSPLGNTTLPSQGMFDDGRQQKRLANVSKQYNIGDDEPTVEPYFTLPDLSVMTDSTTLTALVGKIFTDDIKDPWPFKVMVGKDNLTANHHDLPGEIEGMLVEGYAVGDWTLSCVRGWVTVASFVFEDGRTVAAYSENDGARPEASRFSSSAIGYISDVNGNPCVKGVKATDAPKYLAGRFSAAALAGYGEALNAANEQHNTTTNADGSVNTVTSVLEGSVAYATNSAFSDAFAEGAQWIRERQKQSFDAVYVPAGVQVVFNLQSELWLDKKPESRKIRYEQNEVANNEMLD